MTRRVQKVAELLKQQLAIMVKETIECGADELGIVTVTDVQVSSDIKKATVFISCLDKTGEREVLKRLTAKTRDFQHFLGRKLEMKFTPKLEFKIDTGLEEINHVEEILNNINQQ